MGAAGTLLALDKLGRAGLNLALAEGVGEPVILRQALLLKQGRQGCLGAGDGWAVQVAGALPDHKNRKPAHKPPQPTCVGMRTGCYPQAREHMSPFAYCWMEACRPSWDLKPSHLLAG